MRTRIEPVIFDSNGVALRGNVFLPEPVIGRLPAVVVAGTWTSVKEQMADRYAQRLAERGFAALSFDFTGYGESAGEPRNVESPAAKIEDLRHAVSFLSGHPAVDAERVGALGICAGAMYASAAAASDRRIRALALVAPWLHDAAICAEVYGGSAGVAEKISIGQQARKSYEETGQVEYVPVVSGSDPRAAMPFDIDFYLNPERGGIPQWDNRFALMAWPGWLSLDAVALAPQITVPTLLVHSEDAAIPDGARRFHSGLTVTNRFVWTDGVQFDFYDQEPTVTTAVESAADLFHATL